MPANLLEVLQTPQGAISLAVAVLAAVMGVRLLGPDRLGGRAVAAAIAYAAALAVTWLGGSGVLSRSPEPPLTVRLAGAALLVFGLLQAGRSAREEAGRSAQDAAGREGAGATRKVLGGLAMVLAGQVLRAPSPAGVAAALAAAAVLGWAAWRAPGAGRPPERMNH